MPYSVRCKACSAVFAIPDDIWNRRVRGRAATLKCRSCKGDIQVDGTKENAGNLSEELATPEATATFTLATDTTATPIITPTASSTTTPSTSRDTPAMSSASGPNAEPLSTSSKYKPQAKAPSEIAATETGWSIMPPAAEIAELSAIGDTAKPAADKSEIAPKPTASLAKPATTPVTLPTNDAQNALPVDLWVVSYGEDDDRELTEKQIAAELSRGKINTTTIVWRDGMTDWLPISGVKELSKYLPATKSRPIAAKLTTSTTKTTVTKPLAPSPAPTPKIEHKAAIQPQATPRSTPNAPHTTLSEQSSAREKQPSLSRVGQNAPPPLVKTDTIKQSTTTEKGPPPLTRVTQKSAEKIASSSDSGTRVPRLSGGKPPTIPTRTDKFDKGNDASVPWRKAQESSDQDEILTSAPNVSEVSVPEPPRLPPTVTTQAPAVVQPNSQPSAINPSPTIENASTTVAPLRQDEPSHSASHTSLIHTSFRPPKPVETATSLVVHTHNTPAPDVFQLTDDDFLAMQRRFPKWALPAAIGGGIVLLGLIVYLAVSGEEPPPLPIAPVVVPANTATTGSNKDDTLRAIDAAPATNANAKPSNGSDTDFARAFAKAAGKGGTFDAQAAERAASAAIERATKCHWGGDPDGIVKAVVIIDPRGQVTDVQVSPPHGNRATGKCVSLALRNFSVKPFQGEPAKLPLSITLR